VSTSGTSGDFGENFALRNAYSDGGSVTGPPSPVPSPRGLWGLPKAIKGGQVGHFSSFSIRGSTLKNLEKEAVAKLLREQRVESARVYKEITCGKQGESTAKKKKIWVRPRRHLEIAKVCCGWQALVYFSSNVCWSLIKASDSCWCVNQVKSGHHHSSFIKGH